MDIILLVEEFKITIIELKDSEIMLGYTTFLNHILIIGKQVIYSSQLRKL